MSRGLHTKLPIHVQEELKRPEAPMQAAKFASEGGIIMRGHIPILTRRKDYKTDNKKTSQELRWQTGCGQFDIDTTSQHVIEACTDMLKLQQRQRRYRLKKKFFNDLPAHEERCTINTDNHGLLRFPQHIGSRSYREKRAEGDPIPIDLFKNFHCSKNGYTVPVQAVIEEEIQADLEIEKKGGTTLAKDR
uniref:Uncharacterized protein n=1 Tax=Setaria italica TaxID=4555 RepID=K4AK73_SETIT